MIAVDRKAGAKALRHMVEDSRRAVAEARQVVIFPEGTRTAPGSTRPYQPGVAMLYDIGARSSGGPQFRALLAPAQLSPQAGRIVIEFLPAIPAGLDRRTFLARLSDEIETATTRLIAETGDRSAAS